jgi:hypothetical protein
MCVYKALIPVEYTVDIFVGKLVIQFQVGARNFVSSLPHSYRPWGKVEEAEFLKD